MKSLPKHKSFWLSVCVAVLCAGTAHAFQFKASDSVSGNLDMQLTLGAGMRMVNQNPGLIGDTRVNAGANTFQSSNGDDGDLNYNKNDLYTTYLKFTPELLLKFPADFKFMARGTALYDFKATDTRRTDLEDDAEKQIARDVQLLDLWVSKDLNIGTRRARIRAGNQVISWGESLFGIGGIDSAMALDFQKFSIPGTQIKEAVIPAPMISVATGLGYGFNVEAFYQFRWNRNRVAPVGTYFSVGDIYGKGMGPVTLDSNQFNFGGFDAAQISGARDLATLHQFQQRLIAGDFAGSPFFSVGVPFNDDKTPKNTGQYGAAMHYKPQGTSLDVGFYFMNYHDKMPVMELLANGTLRWDFLENRKLYGISTNFPLGNWAIGWELSYRPKDAVALTFPYDNTGVLDSATAGIVGVTTPLWIDTKKYQMHLTGLLSMTPGDHGWFLNLLWADTASFAGELVFTRYQGVSPGKRYARTFDGVAVTQAAAAGYGFWKDDSTVGTLGYPIIAGFGDATSMGVTADFNWAYDNKIIKGWQVIPGVTYFQAIKGNTPTFTANYLQGAKSANFYVLFNQSAPSRWQGRVNYTAYWGTNQLLADRDFLGAYLTRNF
ncbi:MAG TPA: DUF1302 domain-containing protein [Candidatus Methylomirabilis sp.]|nr:DUF1302 domain-containing protein [Candidatus Methylomirabilis sp.]